MITGMWSSHSLQVHGTALGRSEFRSFRFTRWACAAVSELVPDQWVVFSSLAYAEMRLIMARLLWNFDVAMEPGYENWFDEQYSVLTWIRDKLNVRLTKVVHE
jgi:hypothetical protein